MARYISQYQNYLALLPQIIAEINITDQAVFIM